MMRGIAIILGGAMSVWGELHKAQELIGERPYIIVAANHAGRDYPGHVDHHCTMHPDLFPKWLRERQRKCLPMGAKLWHARHRKSPVDSTPLESWGGSSGLLCTKLALDLGATHVILCGVPMDQRGCHYDKPGSRWMEASQYHAPWKSHVPHMQDKVRSMSGWTAALLGRPDQEFLND